MCGCLSCLCLCVFACFGCARLCAHAHVGVCARICVLVCAYVCVGVCMFVCVSRCVRVNSWVFVCAYMGSCVSMRQTQTDEQTD